MVVLFAEGDTSSFIAWNVFSIVLRLKSFQVAVSLFLPMQYFRDATRSVIFVEYR